MNTPLFSDVKNNKVPMIIMMVEMIIMMVMMIILMKLMIKMTKKHTNIMTLE